MGSVGELPGSGIISSVRWLFGQVIGYSFVSFGWVVVETMAIEFFGSRRDVGKVKG